MGITRVLGILTTVLKNKFKEVYYDY